MPAPSDHMTPSSQVTAAIVSLQRARGRRALMDQTFAKAGVRHRFFDAVDAGSADGQRKLSALPAAGPLGGFGPKDKACTQSHLDLLSAFQATSDTHIAVFEDDVHLADDLVLWLRDLSWWPADADVVKLERWCDDRLVVAVGRRGATHLGRAVLPLLSKHSGTGGYMITQKGAARVLAHGTPNCPIDHLLFNPTLSPVARDLTTYQVEPALVIQGNEPTDPDMVPADLPIQWSDPERKWRRELRRGLYELSGVPSMAGGVVSARARLTHITWAKTTEAGRTALGAPRPSDDLETPDRSSGSVDPQTQGLAAHSR